MKKKVSLVLSGGGARGLAHIGVIEELEVQGFEIVSIAGTSMGSVIGGMYALGKMTAYKEWMYSLDMTKVFSLIDFAFSTQGLIKGDKVFAKMKEFIQDEKIEHLKIPFAAVATDLLNRKEVVFRKGSMYEALRASVAIPTVITPIKTKHTLLVDGGVYNNIPVNEVTRVDGDILVVVDVNANVPIYKPKISKKKAGERHLDYMGKLKNFYKHIFENHGINKDEHLSYFDLMDQTMSLMAQRISELELQKHCPDILINVSRDSCGTFDFYKAERMVETGRHLATLELEKIRRKNMSVLS